MTDEIKRWPSGMSNTESQRRIRYAGSITLPTCEHGEVCEHEWHQGNGTDYMYCPGPKKQPWVKS